MKNKIPEYGTPEWGHYQYEQAKIANRGHNYQYWNEEKHGKMLKEGWELYKFDKRSMLSPYSISAESIVQEIVKRLKNEGNFARIIAGYSKNKQRQKMFSILFKKK